MDHKTTEVAPRLSVSFVYCFVLERIPMGADSLEGVIAHYDARTDLAKDPACRIAVAPSAGFTPYLNVVAPSLEVDLTYALPDSGGRISGVRLRRRPFGRADDIPFSSLDARIRVLESGIGSLTFQLRLQTCESAGVDIDLLLLASEAAPTVIIRDDTDEGFPRLQLRTAEYSLYGLFEHEVSSLASVLEASWVDKPGVMEGLLEPNPDAAATRVFASTPHALPQTPFPVFVLSGFSNSPAELRSLHRPRSAQRTAAEESLRTKTAALVARLYNWEDLSLQYAYENAQLLDSSFPADSVFLNIYARSCVCITDRSWDGNPIEGILVESVLQVVELLRTRWHSLVYARGLLERHSALIQASLRSYATPHRQSVDGMSPEDLAEENRIARTQVYAVMDHPGSYRMTPGSLAELYEKGADAFRIPSLQQVVLSKLDECTSVLETLRDTLDARVASEKMQNFSRQARQINYCTGRSSSMRHARRPHCCASRCASEFLHNRGGSRWSASRGIGSCARARDDWPVDNGSARAACDRCTGGFGDLLRHHHSLPKDEEERAGKSRQAES